MAQESSSGAGDRVPPGSRGPLCCPAHAHSPVCAFGWRCPCASGGPVRKGCAVPPGRHVRWRSPQACVLGQELRARVPEHTRDVRCPSFPKEKGAREAGPLTHWGWKCGDRRLAGPTPVLPPGNWADEPQVGPLARGPWGVTRFPRGQSMLWLSGPIGLATAGQGWGRAPLLTSLCAQL